MRTAEDWDGIWTVSEYDASFESAENGDLYVYYSGPMYWANHTTPGASDLVTFAAAGVYFDGEQTYEESPLSDPLTVGFGQKAFKYNTDETP